ncbi:hypothetical protein [Clostridium sp. Cult3]|uniref:hypothetical protein n=1 Tax=Clostridium sp. Cult3 TaxID=2079004 RepID=UPI001F45CA75|nr:hypothetical protein [Clostridium sp. Cult3]MCF6459671.1 hypothetical protein [Clostridium sp. Cult3]
MVNPLARVVMNNVAKKTNPGRDSGSKGKMDNLNLKKLDTVAGEIKKDYKGNERSNEKTSDNVNRIDRSNFTNKVGSEKKVSNLTPKEQGMIQNLIKGEKVVKESNTTATMVSLDEIAKRVKGSR